MTLPWIFLTSDYIRQAISLNPHYTCEYLDNLGMGYYALEEYDTAIEYLLDALEQNANFSPARRFLVAAYVGKGMLDDAEVDHRVYSEA